MKKKRKKRISEENIYEENFKNISQNTLDFNSHNLDFNPNILQLLEK